MSSSTNTDDPSGAAFCASADEALRKGTPEAIPDEILQRILSAAVRLYAAKAEDRAGELPMFGVTPCPVTIFTFGMLLLTRQPVPRLLLAIPGLWSLVGGSAAMLLRVPQDWLLLVSGAIAVALLIRRDRRLAPA